ncbi:MAG: glycosyl hydrolase-related protein [Acidimicrobiia bacterium]|nr:glycosyl hydrolase-related protein [Acidimicrobiia bacterium]
MTDHGRIDGVLAEVVKPARWPEACPVAITANHLQGEPETHDVAVAGDFVPFAEGDAWGPDWGTTWFHVIGAVPDDWAGRYCALLVDLGYRGGTGFGAEGQVWIGGQPVHGISPNHREVLVGAPAAGGELIDLYIEAAANPPTPPEDPARLLMADHDGDARLTLRRCHLSVVDRAVEELVRDWVLAREMATWLEGDCAAEAAAALGDVCSLIERHGVDPETVAEGRRRLAEVLGRTNGDVGHTHLAVGNSHLDTAWLWPLRETHRKAARTFSTAVTMLDREADYRFAASQAQQFAWIRDEHPGLWDRIKSHVAERRFDLVGSMWVETDCNIPSGESLVRQIVHGKRFFRDELGVDTPGVWLPDTFGYSAALPQILAQAGIDWFMTQKISWNDTNHFPHHTFWWEGIDGTRVFTHLPPADTYNGDLSVPNLLHGARNFGQKEVRDLSLYLYGHGDGGGGPDADMLGRARRLADLDGVGRVELTTASQAMARIRAEGDDEDLPVWAGELYLELHRGTYTTHGAVKRANRRLEGSLRDAELWSTAAHRLTGTPVPVAELDRAWKTLLLHQFHDIIPGSSIHWVYTDTHADHGALHATTERLIDTALGRLAASVDTGDMTRPALVANPLPVERHEIVDIDGIPTAVNAPPCGWDVVDLDDLPPLDAPAVTVGDRHIDNGTLRVSWDTDGLLTSVFHHPTGREALAPGARGNVLQLLDDTPENWDAWDIDLAAFATGRDLTDVDTVDVVEATDDRVTVRTVRSFGASRIEQHMRLTRGGDRLEIECGVDWHEDHKLLKVAFPVDVRAARATHEIQFGHVERPTHANTSWDAARFETCAHTWVDLSEPGFGVALLNDCKYGHDVRGNTIRLSLLRAPTWPDPVADRGHHTFTYALYPHAGGVGGGGVITAAHALNAPLRVHPITETGSDRSVPVRHSMVAVDDPGVVVTAFKAADNGDATVVRLHEAFGARRRVTMHVPGTSSADFVDLLEEPTDRDRPAVDGDGIHLDLGPFELVTLRLR